MCTTSEIPQLFHLNHIKLSDIKKESEGYDTITFEDYKITENYSNQIIKEEPVDYYEIVEVTNVIDIHPEGRICDSEINGDENSRKKLYNENEKFIEKSVKNLSDSEKLIERKLEDYKPKTFINELHIPIKLLSSSEDSKCPSDVNSKQENNFKSEQEEFSAVTSQTFSIKDLKCFLVHDHSYSQSTEAHQFDNFNTDDEEESTQEDEILKSNFSTRLKKVRHSSLKFDEKFDNLELKRNKSKLKCDKGSTNKKKSKIFNNTSILYNGGRRSTEFNSESSEDSYSDSSDSNSSRNYSNSKFDESMDEDEDGIQYKELLSLELNKALLKSKTIFENSEDDHSCYTKNHELKQQSANASGVRCDIRINNAMDLKKCFENSSVASTNSSKSIKSCSKKTLESRNSDLCSSNSSLNITFSSNNQQNWSKTSQDSPSHSTKLSKSNIVELLTISSDSDSESQKMIKKLVHNESKTTTTSQSNLYLTCPECPMIFHDTLRLNRHKKTHQRPQFHCRNCLRKFKRKSMLKKHFCDIKCSVCPDICTCRMEDSKDCMICQKINFRYFVDFKNHKLTHHNEIIYCKICEKNNYTLFRHKQYGHKHEVVKTFKCTECTSVFKTKEQLEYHMEIHAKNFPCSICSKIFTRRYLLKQHELTHKNPKQFYCEICEKSFQRKFCLDNHRKNIHGDKKKEENYLKKHRGMYGEKSLGWISCEQCPALFRNKQSHQRHLNQVH